MWQARSKPQPAHSRPGARWHRATAAGSCSASPTRWRLRSRGSHARSRLKLAPRCATRLAEQVLSYTRREPLGVAAAIIPWNAPVLLGALKIAPALCAGNTLVLKAAEDAPLGVLMMATICHEFLPAGVLNVLTGLGEECGGPLTQHPLVRKLSFTGSTEVGKIIMRAAADRIVPVSLELGGKSPSIVYPDADEDWVVDG